MLELTLADVKLIHFGFFSGVLIPVTLPVSEDIYPECDFITESKEEISDAMALQRRVQRFIKAEAQNITDGLNSEHKIDLMEAAALKAAHGKQSFKIVMPSNVIMIRADNEPESISKASGDDIVVNIDKMNENAERRKNKWRSD